MSSSQSVVVSMRLPAESGRRLKRMARRHGWTASDAGARLVEEGLRRSEFAFIDFRDSMAGRQACLQGSTLAVWEVMLLVRAFQADAAAVARHLRWPEAKVRAAVQYADAFPEEIEHISPAVASGLRRRSRTLEVSALAEWEGGGFLGLADAVCLHHAAAHGWTLVTYDRRTIPPLLRSWAEAGQHHGGVIFVDEKTIPPAWFTRFPLWQRRAPRGTGPIASAFCTNSVESELGNFSTRFTAPICPGSAILVCYAYRRPAAGCTKDCRIPEYLEQTGRNAPQIPHHGR